MELKNKLVVGLMSAMLAFTGLACAGDDTTEGGGTDTGGGVEAPAEGGDLGGATGDTGGGATEGGATP